MIAEPHSSYPDVYTRIATELSLQVAQIQRTVALLLEEATVPFIARYRKEATGNLDEEVIRHIAERYKYYQDLEQRRATILATIAEQGKLTDELRQQIEQCYDKVELEDLYLPYRPKRQTKASVAIGRGLEPLAQLLWEQQAEEQQLIELATSLVNAEAGVNTVEEAIAGAGHIIAERVAENAELRKALRAMMLSEGIVHSAVVAEKKDHKTKFQDYYDFREAVALIPSHRILAILRGVRENLLTVSIEIDETNALALVYQQILHGGNSLQARRLIPFCEDAYHRLLFPSLQNEVRRLLKERADSEAITVFQGNLRNLLLAPPLGAFRVLGVDPGLRTGCKLAVVDETGKYLEYATIFPLVPRNDVAGSEQMLGELLDRHQAKAIAIGNGTGSREAETFVRQFLRKSGRQDCICVVVNEAGASVYSASKIARQEFPDLDLTVRGAISIARRLQDPLAELVKIDPKSIGVGQYQHDVEQKLLRLSLEETVESCVNRVGVDVNTASAALLQYVSGLNTRQAQNVVTYRNTHGRFARRQQLLEVEGLGEKTFQQAAGFLRIKDGDTILDNTAVHPETYRVVEKMAASLAVSLADLVANTELIGKLNLQQFVDEQVGLLTLQDVREELLKPGRDPREQFVAPHFREDVTSIGDLQEGMILEGVISNVTNFGAFVDIGVHQDGLVHISELSTRYVRDPREIAQVGQVVKVKVLGVDTALQRISLSMKGVEAPGEEIRPTARPRPQPAARRKVSRRERKKPPVVQAPANPAPVPPAAEEPETDMAEKLRALQARFQGVGRS